MEKLFAGLKVVDFSTNIAGPTAGGMLADFGAEVIKIEKPSGEDGRTQFPFLEGNSIVNLWLNRGKRSIGLPLDDPEGIKIAKELIDKADVVIEGFRPGVMKKFGLDYESVSATNPRIVYCSISFFGQKGKFSQRRGYDILAQALTGIANRTGETDGPPMRVGIPITDYMAGFNAFGGISASLYYRERTGYGQHVDIALFNVGLSINHDIEITGLGHTMTRSGNISKVVSPSGIYTSKKGSIALQAYNEAHWKALCECINHPELANHPDLNSSVKRVKSNDLVTSAITDWMDSCESISIAEKKLQEAGIVAAKVCSNAEALEIGIEADNGMITEMETPEGMQTRSIKARGVHIGFSKTPGKLSKGCPPVGANSREILKELGYEDAIIDKLITKWNESK
jgi:CoA:oxalate CoA-transferase